MKRSLFLATGAIKGVAAGQDHAFYRPFADQAIFSGPTIDRQVLLEAPACSRAPVVADGGAALADGRLEGVLDLFDQSVQSCLVDSTCRFSGPDAGFE